MIMHKTVLPMLAGFAALALTAAEPNDFRYAKELFPPEAAATARLNSVKLDAEVLSAVSSFDDLRLFSASGQELPFKRERMFQRAESVRTDPVPGAVQSFELIDQRAVIIVAVGPPPHRGARVNQLTIRTAEQNFEKKVAIYGWNGGDWQLLTENQLFFDRNPRFNLSNHTFDFPDGYWKRLKIEIGNYGEDYVSPLRKITTGEDPLNRKEEHELLFRELKIDSVELSRNVPIVVSTLPLEVEYPLEVIAIKQDAAAKTTVIAFRVNRVPLTRIKLFTGSRDFSRRAVYTEEGSDFQQEVRFESFDFTGLHRLKTEVRFDAERRPEVGRLTIFNGDNPPLEKPSLKAYGPAYHLLTLNRNVPARLCYAGNGLPPGDYDLAQTLSGLDTAIQNVNSYRAGEQRENPDFRTRFRPDWNGKVIFTVIIAVLALALLVFIVKNFAKIEKELPEK
jgi:hypothetical protein